MNKLSKILIGVCSVLVLIIFFLVTRIMLLKKDNLNYDVSSFNNVTINDILSYLEDKDTYIVFMGREGCDLCQSMIPSFTTIQKDNNYITQYLDITTVNRNTDSWKNFINLLDIETTQTISDLNEEKEITNTIGYFLDNYGYTPITIIIKDGKIKDGHIGYLSIDDLFEFIAKNITDKKN